MKPQTYDYKHFKTKVHNGRVSVFNANYAKNPELFRTTSIDLAARWIDGYIVGEHWAIEARLPPSKVAS